MGINNLSHVNMMSSNTEPNHSNSVSRNISQQMVNERTSLLSNSARMMMFNNSRGDYLANNPNNHNNHNNFAGQIYNGRPISHSQPQHSSLRAQPTTGLQYLKNTIDELDKANNNSHNSHNNQKIHPEKLNIKSISNQKNGSGITDTTSGHDTTSTHNSNNSNQMRRHHSSNQQQP